MALEKASKKIDPQHFCEAHLGSHGQGHTEPIQGTGPPALLETSQRWHSRGPLPHPTSPQRRGCQPHKPTTQPRAQLAVRLEAGWGMGTLQPHWGRHQQPQVAETGYGPWVGAVRAGRDLRTRHSGFCIMLWQKLHTCYQAALWDVSSPGTLWNRQQCHSAHPAEQGWSTVWAVTGGTGHRFVSCQLQVRIFLSSSACGKKNGFLLPFIAAATHAPKGSQLHTPMMHSLLLMHGRLRAPHSVDWAERSRWPAPKIKMLISLSKQMHKNAHLWDCE